MTESKGYKTIPLRPETWERLRDYKMGGATYDDVINDLMRAVPIERFSAKVVRTHRDRAKAFKGKDWREIRRALKD